MDWELTLIWWEELFQGIKPQLIDMDMLKMHEWYASCAILKSLTVAYVLKEKKENYYEQVV